ncbi:MAG: C40 family peptidase [Agathobacter sp.]|nr:C40 family peptidase [Agathobacter sp.]MBQ4068051.1 C40 family peptidase [Lachnospiraceae bacterium]
MNFDKKTLIGVSSVLVFAMVLGLSSVTIDYSNRNMIDKDNYGIQSSAGANAAIGENGNNTVAGVNGAVEDSVGVVDIENILVGQGTQYNTFGYTNLGLAVVDGNLNIRKEANTSSSVVGKMTNYAACEILGEENGFYKVSSGNAEGYVSMDYIITGEEALAIAQTEAKYIATVITETLRVRTAPTTESKIISTISKDEEFYILEDLDGWFKVELTNFQGYISKDYVKAEMKLKTGNTMKELTYGNGISDTRVNLVNFALQYVGGRYVWGGERLGVGVDCSGFTMKVYEQFGIKLPHYSASQPSYGTRISRAELKPGDLIFYSSSNRIDHVAIYIGNGQIVHAASTKAGIIISNAFYSQPVCYVRYLD